MSRWTRYLVIFLLGGLYATLFYPTFLSRKISPQPIKQMVISDGAASATVVQVDRVIDGDTIELIDGRRVRYIGIDTPEMGDPRKNVECFGKEAMEENKRLVEGKTVRLEKDVSETDKYGRLLRYVYLGDVFINDYLVRQGFARIDTVPPDMAHQQKFLYSEQEARREGRGLWARCP